MIPLLIGLIGGGLAAIVGYWLSDSQKQKLNGKKIAILGARGSGKSRLFEFIATDELGDVSQYNQTKSQESVGKKYGIEEITKDFGGFSITFDLLHSYDVGGSEANYEVWKKGVANANFLLYLVNSQKLLAKTRESKEYHQTIKSDIQTIAEIARGNNQLENICIVATFFDKLDYFDNANEVERCILNHPVILESQIRLGGMQKCKVQIGSLETKTKAEELFINILQTI